MSARPSYYLRTCFLGCLIASILLLTTALHANSWVEWDTKEGLERLGSSEHKTNFWTLARFYENQINYSYCGIASSVMVLNSLQIQAPNSKLYRDYKIHTQTEFYHPSMEKIVSHATILKQGLNLEELSAILKTFPIKVSSYPASRLSTEQIKAQILPALKKPNQRVLALYDRKVLHQVGSGHWSPIAAYDASSDSYLIMDVSKFKYPPVWVQADVFYEAMMTFTDAGQPRGFIIIEP